MKYLASMFLFVYLASCFAEERQSSTDSYGGTDSYGAFEEDCGRNNGSIRFNFERVVKNQLGYISHSESLSLELLQPIIDAYQNLTQREQTTLLFAIIADDETPAGIRALLDGARSIAQGIFQNRLSLGSAIFEDPLPFKNYVMAFKEYVVGGFVRFLNGPHLSKGLVSFAKVVIEAGNVKYAKLKTIMDALKQTERCGYSANSCPAANKTWMTSLKSAVEHDCISYSSVGYFGKYMGEAISLMEEARHYVNYDSMP